MSDLDVRLQTLPPMRVARFTAMGRAPEREALQRLRAWAEPRGLLGDPESHPVFGFNNPAPTPEVWQKLLSWVQSSEWSWRRTHELEKLVDPDAPERDAVLELYLPVQPPRKEPS